VIVRKLSEIDMRASAAVMVVARNQNEISEPRLWTSHTNHGHLGYRVKRLLTSDLVRSGIAVINLQSDFRRRAPDQVCGIGQSGEYPPAISRKNDMRFTATPPFEASHLPLGVDW
jgi:hypothetical protein